MSITHEQHRRDYTGPIGPRMEDGRFSLSQRVLPNGDIVMDTFSAPLEEVSSRLTVPEDAATIDRSDLTVDVAPLPEAEKKKLLTRRRLIAAGLATAVLTTSAIIGSKLFSSDDDAKAAPTPIPSASAPVTPGPSTSNPEITPSPSAGESETGLGNKEARAAMAPQFAKSDMVKPTWYETDPTLQTADMLNYAGAATNMQQLLNNLDCFKNTGNEDCVRALFAQDKNGSYDPSIGGMASDISGKDLIGTDRPISHTELLSEQPNISPFEGNPDKVTVTANMRSTGYNDASTNTPTIADQRFAFTLVKQTVSGWGDGGTRTLWRIESAKDLTDYTTN